MQRRLITARDLHAHEEVGAVLDLMPAGGELAAGGIYSSDLLGVVRGSVELPYLTAKVAVRGAQQRVAAALRDL